MKEKSFTITAATAQMTPDATGRVRAAFTVTNNTGALVRGAVSVRGLGETQGEWLAVVGECERQFAPKETRQFEVEVAIPLSARPGSWPFRLDACSTESPDDDYTQGPVVAVVITRPEVPPPVKKPFPWWIVIAAVALLLAVAAATWALRKKPPGEFFIAGHLDHVDRAASRLKTLGFRFVIFGSPHPKQPVLMAVSVEDGPMPQTRLDLERFRTLPHGKVAVLFVRSAVVTDVELRELVKSEMDGLLQRNGLDPVKVPELFDDVTDEALKTWLENL